MTAPRAQSRNSGITADERDAIVSALKALMSKYQVSAHTLHKIAEIARREG